MKEKQKIKTLEDLVHAAEERKSVVVPSSPIWRITRPAAFVLNLQARTVAYLLKAGMYVYEPQTKRTPFQRKSKP